MGLVATHLEQHSEALPSSPGTAAFAGRDQCSCSWRLGLEARWPVLNCASCMTLGKLLTLSVPHFPPLLNGGNPSSYLIELLRKLKECLEKHFHTLLSWGPHLALL